MSRRAKRSRRRRRKTTRTSPHSLYSEYKLSRYQHLTFTRRAVQRDDRSGSVAGKMNVRWSCIRVILLETCRPSHVQFTSHFFSAFVHLTVVDTSSTVDRSSYCAVYFSNGSRTISVALNKTENVQWWDIDESLKSRSLSANSNTKVGPMKSKNICKHIRRVLDFFDTWWNLLTVRKINLWMDVESLYFCKSKVSNL